MNTSPEPREISKYCLHSSIYIYLQIVKPLLHPHPSICIPTRQPGVGLRAASQAWQRGAHWVLKSAPPAGWFLDRLSWVPGGRLRGAQAVGSDGGVHACGAKGSRAGPFLWPVGEAGSEHLLPRHHSQQAPWKGTYLGLFHGTISLHHTTILVNEELPRHGVLAEEAPMGPLQEGWGQWAGLGHSPGLLCPPILSPYLGEIPFDGTKKKARSHEETSWQL